MKALRIKTIILSISLIFSFSCKKDELQKSGLTEIKKTEAEYLNKIMWFGDQLKNYKDGKILKSYEKIQIQEALEYIDATLNYQYCFHSARYGNMLYKTIKVEIPVISIEEKTLLVNALEAVTEAELKLKSEYISVQKANKKLVGIRLSNLGINEEKLTLELTAYIGYNSPIVNPPVSEFKYIRDSESCDATVQGYGAPNVIENYINYCLIDQPIGNEVIFKTHLSTLEYNDPTQYVNPIESDETDNLCDYLIFYASTKVSPITIVTECLGINPIYPNEIQFYSNSIMQLVTYDLEQMNQEFHSVFITDNEINDVTRTIKHIVYLTYGTKHVVTNSSFPINIDSL